MRDLVSIRGVFRVLDIPEDCIFAPEEAEEGIRRGHISVAYESHNLIVNNGLSAIATILGGGAGSPAVGGLGVSNIADLTVTRMELGNAVSPPVPVITDTVSVASLVYVPPLLVAYPVLGGVRFIGIVRHSELNGTTFTEEALKMANGLVFAKVNGFSTVKNALHAKQFDHTILFSRV